MTARNPYRDLSEYADGVLSSKDATSRIPYRSLAEVCMDRRFADTGVIDDDESIDTLDVLDVRRRSDSVELDIAASTFAGTVYPIRLILRRPGKLSRMAFGGSLRALGWRHANRLDWSDESGPWAATYEFDLAIGL